MDAFKLEAFKVALFILPGIITLRIKTVLSIPLLASLSTL